MRKRIIYIQFTNPAAYPPLEHSSRILANQGWSVLFLGTGALSGADSFEFPPHSNIDARRLPFVPGGWRQKLHYLRYLAWCVWWAIRWRPQWVYASDPFSCPIALLLNLFPGVRVVYHEHDSPDVNGNHSAFMKLTLWARRVLARRAEICILPNAQRGEVFKEQTRTLRPVLTVWNCPRLEELDCDTSGEHDAADRLKIYYHGNIAPGSVPTSLIHALGLLENDLELLVLGYETVSTMGHGAALLEVSCHYSMGERVTIDTKGRSRFEALKTCAKYDVGLVLFTKQTIKDSTNLKHLVGASNKPFDYMACGLALLVPNFPEWEAMYVEPGFGLSCDPDEPESIAEALRWFAEHPEERRAMGQRGRQQIADEWNYEKQFQPVLDRLNKR